jgi:hypothetical protein
LGGVLLAIFVNIAAAEAIAVPLGQVPAMHHLAQAPPDVAPAPALEAAPAEAPALEVEEEASSAPPLILQIDGMLEPLVDAVGLLYLIGDIVLLVIAGTLLVAFWGGRYSQSWKLIAIAAFCLYIADMFFAYAINTDTYVEGSLWEVFWTFSAIFFGLGAVVEHAVSVNSRRSPRRRRG